MEPGLVIELRNGDGVAFCSNKITHLTLISRVSVHIWFFTAIEQGWHGAKMEMDGKEINFLVPQSRLF